MSVLFSPLGNSDPVRNLHDGPALHIIRHYHEISDVYFFLTKDISIKHNKFNYYAIALDDLIKKTKRSITYTFIESNLDDPHDFDKSYDLFAQELKMIYEKHPEKRILLNVTSGTPQMNMNLCLLASQNHIPNLIAIRVTDPSKGKGNSPTTNNKDYDFESNLQINEDNSINKNRCEEISLITILKVKKISQINRLVENYNYSAALSLLKDDIVNPNLIKLIKHLNTRQETIDREKSLKHMDKQTYKSIQLFPSKNKSITELIEYFLVIKNLEKNNQITDMYFRLNNFLIELEKAFITKILKFDLNTITYLTKGKKLLSKSKILNEYPLLLEYLDKEFNTFNDKSIFSVKNLNVIIKYINSIELIIDTDKKSIVSFFEKMVNFSENRNIIAHGLEAITKSEFNKITNYSTTKFIEKLEDILLNIYPKEVTKNYLNIYNILNNEIKLLLGG